MDRPAGRVESGPRTVQILAGRVGSGRVTLFPDRVGSGRKIWTRVQLCLGLYELLSTATFWNGIIGRRGCLAQLRL